MKPVQRVEIVIGAPHVPSLLRALRGAGARGYTLISGASGAGDRGIRHGDDPAGSSGNQVVLCAVEPELLDDVVKAVRPLLTRYGGMALVSDAQRILHGDEQRG